MSVALFIGIPLFRRSVPNLNASEQSEAPQHRLLAKH